MSEGVGASPRDLVFTTMVWDQARCIADLDAHLERMQHHAKRLRIEWPADMKRSIAEALATLEFEGQHPTCQPMGLLRLELARDGTINVQPRSFSIRNESVEAITVEAPRWSPKVNGTKHGDWQPYRDARQKADHAGTDLALLVHEYAIVDGDRATPLVFDEDSTAWLSDAADGGVTGITAEILAPLLEAHGIPVQRGRLNERLVARAIEVIAVRSGLGVAQIESIDGEQISTNHGFAIKCQSLLTQHYENKNAWSDVGA